MTPTVNQKTSKKIPSKYRSAQASELMCWACATYMHILIHDLGSVSNYSKPETHLMIKVTKASKDSNKTDHHTTEKTE